MASKESPDPVCPHRSLSFEELIHEGGDDWAVILSCDDCDKELILTGELEER